MKKIIFLTGTRAYYGKIKSLMKKLENMQEFRVYIYITGMHLNKKFGSTYKAIEKDGFKKIFLAKSIEDHVTMDVALAENSIFGLCKKSKTRFNNSTW